jgi:hypothetical protein
LVYREAIRELSPLASPGCNTNSTLIRLADIWPVLVAWIGKKLPGMWAMLCAVDADAAVAAESEPAVSTPAINSPYPRRKRIPAPSRAFRRAPMRTGDYRP